MPQSMTVDRDPHLLARESLCKVVRDLGTQGWCQGTAGNFSVVLSREPLRLLMSPSGIDKRHIVPGDFLVVEAGGDASPEETRRPSAETKIHLQLVSQVGTASVLHVHSVSNTLLGEHFMSQGGFHLRGYEMLKGLEGIGTHETEVFVPVLRNRQDMEELSGEVGRLLDERPGLHGFLLAGHGMYTWGDSLEQAQRHVEIFEFLFECAARRTRFEPFLG